MKQCCKYGHNATKLQTKKEKSGVKI